MYEVGSDLFLTSASLSSTVQPFLARTVRRCTAQESLGFSLTVNGKTSVLGWRAVYAVDHKNREWLLRGNQREAERFYRL